MVNGDCSLLAGCRSDGVPWRAGAGAGAGCVQRQNRTTTGGGGTQRYRAGQGRAGQDRGAVGAAYLLLQKQRSMPAADDSWLGCGCRREDGDGDGWESWSWRV